MEVIYLFLFQLVVVTFIIWLLLSNKRVLVAFIVGCLGVGALWLVLRKILVLVHPASSGFVHEMDWWLGGLPYSITFMPCMPGIEVRNWLYSHYKWPVSEEGGILFGYLVSFLTAGAIWLIVAICSKENGLRWKFALVYCCLLLAYWLSLNLFPRHSFLLYTGVAIPFVRPLHNR